MERGFAATRVADVAAKLGVSTGLIHYHFASKELLLAEAFRMAARSDLSRLTLEVSTARTAIAKLDKAFRLYTPIEAEAVWMLWIDGWGEAIRNPRMKKISQELDIEWKDTLEKIIYEGIDNGEFTCSDPNATAWRLAALLDGLGVQATVHEGVITRRQLVNWVRSAACRELDLPEGAFVTKRR